jgi:hypothetical protein
MALEPCGGEPGHLLKCAVLLEQVRCAGDDRQLRLHPKSVLRVPVELEHDLVAATDDQEHGGSNFGQKWGREVWAAAPRDDGADLIAQVGRRP